ncbi:MAG: hypothetical protein A2719_01840 [Candidatus Ryanbacteria bacterium RIFCSPHIGHO2_01_FULL_45_22]|uniref:Aspartate kinase n=2 Tax=Candidatus Ryaniibacteriota TaxID=1817914 RepID=A0A1G2FZC0_9BACT|nr:MAG: hypothetical protein A2719_01840 [Candidatus Ryanbacteria bacterium RIFCSPHIGHO2_01_FULL_45_22]OGZ45363.1 MAG: hypothetical protein A3J54_03935 [Candidatus Ryanbacteria bacterium RIFCSPHIGHO2_02_FULL_45_13b]
MIKVNDIVESILFKDEEALTALAKGYMNLSKYAKKIHNQVEEMTKKEVGIPGIVVALSRISRKLDSKHPLIQDVQIKNITTKAPLSEIVYSKTSESISKLAKIYARAKTGTDDFFTMTLSTNEITVICSDRIKKEIEKILKEKPVMVVKNLASIGLSLDPKYYPMPNITFSLIRRIAQKRIPLAETITTRTEIIFVFEQKYVSEMVDLYVVKED